jgi:hypothetical protein
MVLVASLRCSLHLQPDTDDMFMIDPRPCFRISGIANLHIITMLVTLIRKSRSQASRLMVVASPMAPPTPTSTGVSII